MNSKDFENHCKYRMDQEEAAGRATMGRYGVQASFMRGNPIADSELVDWAEQLRAGRLDESVISDIIARCKTAENTFRPIQSLPDFEGVLAPSGRQFLFDAKVCSAASMDLHSSHVAERQLDHLRKRAAFGAIAFLLIHFPERTLKAGTQAAVTWAFPVCDNPFWQAFDRGEEKRISRADCEEYGVLVPWNRLPGGRTDRPDVLAAVLALAEQPLTTPGA